MSLCDVFVGLGEENLRACLSRVSLGKLKTYQLFDRMKTRLHLGKLNQESLRKVSPRVWTRLESGDADLATDLSQAVLVSHLDMVIATLNFLGVPHQDGFFEKDADVASYLSSGWQQRAFDEIRGSHPESVVLFYVNHLAHEVTPGTPIFLPGSNAV